MLLQKCQARIQLSAGLRGENAGTLKLILVGEMGEHDTHKHPSKAKLCTLNKQSGMVSGFSADSLPSGLFMFGCGQLSQRSKEVQRRPEQSWHLGTDWLMYLLTFENSCKLLEG